MVIAVQTLGSFISSHLPKIGELAPFRTRAVSCQVFCSFTGWQVPVNGVTAITSLMEILQNASSGLEKGITGLLRPKLVLQLMKGSSNRRALFLLLQLLCL